jgi:hypothetical protein
VKILLLAVLLFSIGCAGSVPRTVNSTIYNINHGSLHPTRDAIKDVQDTFMNMYFLYEYRFIDSNYILLPGFSR